MYLNFVFARLSETMPYNDTSVLPVNFSNPENETLNLSAQQCHRDTGHAFFFTTQVIGRQAAPDPDQQAEFVWAVAVHWNSVRYCLSDCQSVPASLYPAPCPLC